MKGKLNLRFLLLPLLLFSLISLSLLILSQEKADAFGKRYLSLSIRGSDGRIYYRAMYPSGYWTPWRNVPGSKRTVHQSISEFDGRLYSFAMRANIDDRLYYRTLDDEESSEWHVLYLSMRGKPAVCEFDKELYVFARNVRNDIYYRSLDVHGDWNSWQRIPESRATAASPAVCTFDDSIYLFRVKANRRDRIYYRRMDNDNWSDWETIRCSTKGEPAVCQFNDKLYLFTRNAGDCINYNSMDRDGDWGTWEKVSDSERTTTSPAVCSFGNKLYLFRRKSDSRLYYRSMDKDEIWSNWQKFSRMTRGAPAVTVSAQIAPAATPTIYGLGSFKPFDITLADYTSGISYEGDYLYPGTEATDSISDNLKNFFDLIKNHGFNLVNVQVTVSDGTYFWNSQLLDEHPEYNYVKGPDLLTPIIREAHKRGIFVSMGIETLGRVILENGGISEYGTFGSNNPLRKTNPDIRPLTSDELYQVIRELASIGADAIYEKGYSRRDSDMDAIRDAIEETGLTWIHFFGDYKGRPDVIASQDYVLYPETKNNGTSAVEIGFQDIYFGHGRAIGKKAFVATGSSLVFPELQKNFMLFRTVESDPAGYLFDGATDSSRRLLNSINFDFETNVKADIHMVSKKLEEKPIANLVLNRPSEDDTLLLSYFNGEDPSILPTVCTAIEAAGYDLRVSYNSIIEDADLYYVISFCGEQGEEEFYDDLPYDQLGLLLYSNTPTIIHPATPLSDSGNWAEIRTYFGLEADGDYPTIYDMPETVTAPFEPSYGLKGATTPFKGIRYAVVPATARILESDVSSPAEVVLAGNVDSAGDIALILRRENKFLINSSVIHLMSHYILANILSTLHEDLSIPYESPCFAYVVRGNQTAILACGTTEVNLNLPSWPVSGHRFSSTGNRTTITYSELVTPFTATLTKGELIILESE